MRKPRVLLDADGVLLNLLLPTLEVMEEVAGIRLKVEDVTEYNVFGKVPPEFEPAFYARIKAKGFCASIPPYPGAIEGVRRIKELADVFVVTSPMDGPYWTHERDQRLQELFDIPYKNVIHAHAKYVCVGDMLVDDKPSHVEEWFNEHFTKNVRALLWSHPYNQSFNWKHRVTSWDEVVRHVHAFL